MFDIKENLKKLPDTPGVYIHKDKLGQVIYVGKAISLRNRVRQYFQSSKNQDAKVKAMVSHIAEFEYITCATEMEALILENNLIKKHMPKYNILLRDDKTYPYIKITTKEKYPRIIKTREVRNDGNKYFGPYSDVKAVNEIIELLNEMLSLKRCSAQNFPEGQRPCLNYHINSCQGICTGKVSEATYKKDIDTAIDILNGKNKKMIDILSQRMEEASIEMKFEDAARCRDQIAALKAICEAQRVTIIGGKDMDVVLAVRGAREHHAVVFFVRDGKLSGRESFLMQAEHSDDSSEIVAEFIKQYYGNLPQITNEIIVDSLPKGHELIEEYLTNLAGRMVKIIVPQKGDKKALLELARRDASEMSKSIDERYEAKLERDKRLSNEIYEVAAESYKDFEKRNEYRIEAYDISNTNGLDTVGAMVVFEGTRPIKKDYRKFKIRTVSGQDDYGSMREVIERRFRRAINGDEAFGKLPDILLIDGGKGQIMAVREALENIKCENLESEVSERLGKDMTQRECREQLQSRAESREIDISSIAIVGMAKDDKHRTRAAITFDGSDFHENELAGKNLLFKYFGTVQEEVHRFAIEYHRNVRGKKMIGSVLDEIEGIGVKKRNALLSHFKSIENIKNADIDSLCEVEGITKKNAHSIKEFFDC